FDFHEERLDRWRSIRDCQLELRFMLEPIESQRYVKGRKAGAQPEVKSLRGIWCRKETSKRDTEEPLAVREIPSQGGDCCLSDLDLAIYYPK
ncbi:hypothetical protein Tco_1147892, partial [Tanacetum coccineum]